MDEALHINRAASANIPTAFGSFQLSVFENNRDDKEHLAIVMGDVSGQEDVLVRIHSECFTGDVLGSRRCDCGDQLHAAMDLIAREGRGIVLYLRQEGRGIGLAEKLKAYNLQDNGLDTVDANLALGHAADGRDYSIAAAILQHLDVRSLRLITNNPSKIEELERLGMAVSERVAVETAVYPENAGYLLTKAQRMNHLLNPVSLAGMFTGGLYPVSFESPEFAETIREGHNGYQYHAQSSGSKGYIRNGNNGYRKYHSSPAC